MMLVNAYPHPQTYQSQEILHKFRKKVTVVELHAVHQARQNVQNIVETDLAPYICNFLTNLSSAGTVLSPWAGTESIVGLLSTMVLLLDSSALNVARMRRLKRSCTRNISDWPTAVDVNKCLERVKLSISLHNFMEPLSNRSTMLRTSLPFRTTLGWTAYYRKSILNLLKWTSNILLSRCSTNLR